MTRTPITALLLGVAAFAAGCQRGPEFAPVEGTITQGGKPMAHVTVEFFPESGEMPRSRSTPTDEAGHYRLSSYRGEEGAVVGAHRVLIFDLKDGLRLQLQRKAAMPPEEAKRFEEQMKAMPEEKSPRVPRSYRHSNETPLRAEVHSGPQTLDFNLP